MTVKVYKNAVPEEAARLREEIFVKEQGFTDEFDEFDSRSLHLVVFDEGEPVATLRFYDEGGGSYHIGRVAVKKDRRGGGLGRQLIDEAVKEVKLLGGSALTVGAQEDKSGFYSRCGFKQCGERYFEQDYPHIPMKKDI